MSQTETATEQQPIKKISDIKEIPLHEEIESGRHAEKWTKIALTAGPRVEREKVEAFFADILELPLNTVIWAENPIDAGRACRLVIGGQDITKWDMKNGEDIPREWIDEQIKEHNPPAADSSYCHYGQHDSYWVGYHLAYDGVPGLDLKEVKAYEPIVRGAGWFFYHEGVLILTPRVTPELDPDGELHNPNGPAIWDELYALHGLVLDEEYEWIVKEHETLTRKKIDSIDNAEVRSVTIASYPEKYVDWEPIQEDSYGALYEIENEDYMLVRVEDASSKRIYWLRVDEGCETAHSAVASTFGMTAEEYNPVLQT